MKYLIVVDMQNDFVTGSLSNTEAQAIVPKIAEYVKNWNGHVIFTRDTHHSDYLDTMEGKNLPVKHCIENSWGWEICGDIENAIDWEEVEDVTFINKPTFGYVKGIKNYIGSLNGYPTSIEVVGTCTDICVVSNVLGLKETYPECKIIVHKNMCAGVTPESHDAALNVMKMCQVEVI